MLKPTNQLHILVENTSERIKEELKLQQEKEAENNRRIVINRSKKVNELYKKISAKNATLQSLFGRDFSILHLLNLKRNIDVTSPEEAINIQVLLLKPMEDKMY